MICLARIFGELQTVERLAAEVGVADRLHLWPDKSLGNVGVANRMPKPREYLRWLRKSWSRVSEWPKCLFKARPCPGLVAPAC